MVRGSGAVSNLKVHTKSNARSIHGSCEPASPMAQLWTVRDPSDVDMVIHVLAGLGPREGQGGGGFDVALFKRLLKANIAELPRFSSVLAQHRSRLGLRSHAAWVPVPVNIEDHVQEVSIPQQGQESSAAPLLTGGAGVPQYRDCVMAYVEMQTLLPLRRDRPLWEVQVLTHPPVVAWGSDPVSPTIHTQSLLWRISHSIGDGVALGALIMKCTTTRGGAAPSLWPLSLLRPLSHAPAPLAQRAARQLAMLYNSLLALLKLILVLTLPADPAGGVKPLSDNIRSARRGLARLALPLDEVKAVASQAGATVNDVLLTLVSAPTHWYQELMLPPLQPAAQAKLNGPMKRTEAVDEIPPYTPRALFMCNIRPLPSELVERLGEGAISLDNAEDRRFLGSPQVPLGTKVGFAVCHLPSTGPAPPEAQAAMSLFSTAVAGRADSGKGMLHLNKSQDAYSACASSPLSWAIESIRKQTAVVKQSFEAAITFFVLNLTCRLFGPKAMMKLCLCIVGKVSTALSNVFGPTERLFLAGSPVLNVDQFVAGCPCGVTVHALSYHKHVHITITAYSPAVGAENFANLMLLAWKKLKLEQKMAGLA